MPTSKDNFEETLTASRHYRKKFKTLNVNGDLDLYINICNRMFLVFFLFSVTDNCGFRKQHSLPLIVFINSRLCILKYLIYLKTKKEVSLLLLSYRFNSLCKLKTGGK